VKAYIPKQGKKLNASRSVFFILQFSSGFFGKYFELRIAAVRHPGANGAFHPALLSDNAVTVRAGTGGAACLWHFTLAFGKIRAVLSQVEFGRRVLLKRGAYYDYLNKL
jgi:hypothetical protein